MNKTKHRASLALAAAAAVTAIGGGLTATAQAWTVDVPPKLAKVQADRTAELAEWAAAHRACADGDADCRDDADQDHAAVAWDLTALPSTLSQVPVIVSGTDTTTARIAVARDRETFLDGLPNPRSWPSLRLELARRAEGQAIGIGCVMGSWVERIASPERVARTEELRQRATELRPGTRAHAETTALLINQRRALVSASAVQVPRFPAVVPGVLVTLAVALGGAAAVTARRENAVNAAENGELK